jgi:monofunctional biosynthetic peptidoglycan transglycosylase
LKLVWNVIKAAFLGYAVAFSLAGTIALFFVAVTVLSPILRVKRLRHSNPKETIYMRDQRELLASQNLPDTLSQKFVPLDSISPCLIKTVLAAEDDGFYTHPGFDIAAIAQAVQHNRTGNGRRRGASTITQQMAKNLFVGGERNFKRKYKELAYAVLMEYFLGKDRILELYMNYAQWGKNIFGCEAASQAYFERPCSELSFDQSARMAAVLAKPKRLSPHFTKSVLLRKRMTVIANNLYRRRSIDTTTWEEFGGRDSLLSLRALLEGVQVGDSPLQADEPGRQQEQERASGTGQENL